MDAKLTRLTAEALSEASSDGLTAFVGLDAFVDEIVHVVASRSSATDFTAVRTIEEFGKRILEAVGLSTNIELVVDRIKLGGNGPIMANALAAFGAGVTAVGPFGEPAIHPAFAVIESRARVVSLGQPGHTDALEFEDGKVMLGKIESLRDVTWERLLDRLGVDEVRRLFTRSHLVALVNWTMLPAMSDIWEQTLSLLAETTSGTTDSSPLFFFDLADPEKHDDATVAAGCRLLARFQDFGPTVLGLNEKEALRVGGALGFASDVGGREGLRAVAAFISDTLPIEAVVVHPRAYAVVAARGVVTADVDGPFAENPLISTGAGDHFNAGFCLGKLLGLPDPEAATTAVGTSGYYVRNAASPSLEQLTGFLVSQSE